MTSTMTESRNDSQPKDKDVRQEIEELKHALELQTVKQAGVDATKVAATTGAQATQAAAHVGTWSTMLAGSVGFVTGMFVALAFVATNRS